MSQFTGKTAVISGGGEGIGLVSNATEAVKNGIAPEIVGKRLVEALAAGERYVFTHPNFHPLIQMRSAAIDDAFERAAASPLLQHIVDQKSTCPDTSPLMST